MADQKSSLFWDRRRQGGWPVLAILNDPTAASPCGLTRDIPLF